MNPQSQRRDVRVLIVGGVSRHHVGFHLNADAREVGAISTLVDAAVAYKGPKVLRALLWRLGRFPLNMGAFQKLLIQQVRTEMPDVVLTTGIAPVSAGTIEYIKNSGIQVINYSTDDPWSRSQYARWYIGSLPTYDAIFTPRMHTVKDFRSIGCQKVFRCMFGYSASVHTTAPSRPTQPSDCDVAIIGGADSDRVEIVRDMVEAGLDVGLWGGYWNRYKDLRDYYRGMISIDDAVRVIRNTPVNVCLVRQSNRDSHSMRTFEIPAAGGCMATVRTEDHRELFGGDVYDEMSYSTSRELIDIVGCLLKSKSLRSRVRSHVSDRVLTGFNTYGDRLRSMIHEC